MAVSSLLLAKQLGTLMMNMKEMVIRKQIILHYSRFAQCEMNKALDARKHKDKIKYWVH